jgi:hypothetical protein
MRGSHLYHFDQLQSCIKLALDKNGDLIEAKRIAAPHNNNRGISKVADLLGGASKSIDVPWLPNFRNGTLLASARHLEPLLLNSTNTLFFRKFHLISRCPQELYHTAMPQVESYTQLTMRRNTLLSLQSSTDGFIHNLRYFFNTLSPQSLTKTPASPPPPGGPLETSSDGDA